MGWRDPDSARFSRRAVLGGVAVTALLALAAAGAGTHPGLSDRRSDRRSLVPALPTFGEYVLLSLLLLLLALEAALVVAAVREHGDVLLERRRRKKRSSVAGLALLAACLASLLYAAPHLHGVWNRISPSGGAAGGSAPASRLPAAGQPAVRRSAGLGLLVTGVGAAVLLVAAGMVGYALVVRPAPPRPEAAGAAVASDLGAGLDALEEIADPRLAVLACYDRLQRTLARHGLAGSPADTPGELLSRVLRAEGAAAADTERLARLFERARFSPHAVDEAMRAEALASLRAVRDALQAGAEREALPT